MCDGVQQPGSRCDGGHVAADPRPHDRAHEPEEASRFARCYGRIMSALMDRRRLSLKNLETTHGELPLIRRIDQKYFGKGPSQATREVVEALLAAKVATMADGWLVSAG